MYIWSLGVRKHIIESILRKPSTNRSENAQMNSRDGANLWDD